MAVQGHTGNFPVRAESFRGGQQVGKVSPWPWMASPEETFPRAISKTVERLISWLPAKERDAKLQPRFATFA